MTGCVPVLRAVNSTPARFEQRRILRSACNILTEVGVVMGERVPREQVRVFWRRGWRGCRMRMRWSGRGCR
jgi:hypothetical protein